MAHLENKESLISAPFPASEAEVEFGLPGLEPPPFLLRMSVIMNLRLCIRGKLSSSPEDVSLVMPPLASRPKKHYR